MFHEFYPLKSNRDTLPIVKQVRRLHVFTSQGHIPIGYGLFTMRISTGTLPHNHLKLTLGLLPIDNGN